MFVVPILLSGISSLACEILATLEEISKLLLLLK